MKGFVRRLTNCKVYYCDLVPEAKWLSHKGWVIESLFFAYRRQIAVTEQSGNDLTDYQVLIKLNSSNFDFSHANEDGSDIRFHDGNNFLSYWIEKWDSANQEAKIWVKVPSIPASSSTSFYMYYGNPNVTSASNGEDTFEFFDDFETWEDWVQYRDGQVFQDSTRYYDGQYSAHKTTANDPNGAYKDIGKTLGRDIVLEFWVNRDSGYSGGSSDRVGVIDSNGNGYGWHFNHDYDRISIDKRDNYTGDEFISSSTEDYMDKWVFARFVISSDGKIKAQRYVDDTLNGEIETTETTYSTFTRVYIFGGYDYWVDQIRIRKYTDPEPSVSIGEEETP